MDRNLLLCAGVALASVSCGRNYYGGLFGDAAGGGGDVAAIGGDAVMGSGDAADDWRDVDYLRRQRLRFINAARGERLDSFTVLVSINNAQFDTASMLVDRSDVHFVDADGTELASEREAPDLHWVRVPSIAVSDEDYIEMYYGGPPFSPTVAAPAWDSDYLSVWHLDPALADSTGNGYSLTPVGAQFGDGWIGPGLEAAANGSSYAMAPAPPAYPALVDAVTACAWFSMVVDDLNFNAVLGRGLSSVATDAFYLGVSNGQLYGEIVDSAGTIVRMYEAAVPTQTWLYGCTAFDGTNVMLFRNGTRVVTELVGLPLASDQVELGVGIDIESGGTADRWEGFVDEVRISTVARSDAWISAEHASMTDALVVVEPVEIQPP